MTEFEDPSCGHPNPHHRHHSPNIVERVDLKEFEVGIWKLVRGPYPRVEMRWKGCSLLGRHESGCLGRNSSSRVLMASGHIATLVHPWC